MKSTLDQSVDRFLGWKLPADFAPDCGISFKRESDYDHPEYGRTKFEPIGTNLLHADQAKAMLEHVCEPMLTALKERDAEIERLKYTVKRRDVGIEICATLSVKLEAKLATQRKVLEQALEALENHAGNYKLNDVQCDHQNATITAIQEQLE